MQAKEAIVSLQHKGTTFLLIHAEEKAACFAFAHHQLYLHLACLYTCAEAKAACSAFAHCSYNLPNALFVIT